MKYPHSSLLTITLFFLYVTGFGQCSGGSSFSSVTAPTGTTSTTISSCNWAGDYNTITNVVVGNTYNFTTSPAACITIHSGSPTGPVVTFGTSSASFTAATAGTHYMTLNTNCSGCGTGTTCLTTTVTCTSCGTPLGEEFIQLTGKNESGLNILEWNSTSESNPEQFIIERSEDGLLYTEIGSVNPRPEVSSYQFEDVQPILNDLSYYRIGLVHKNGDTDYSNILVLEQQFNADIVLVKVFPNPAITNLDLILSSKSETAYQLTLSDLNRRTVWNSNQPVQKGLTYTTIDMSKFQNGFYFLTVTSNGTELSTYKVVKE